MSKAIFIPSVIPPSSLDLSFLTLLYTQAGMRSYWFYCLGISPTHLPFHLHDHHPVAAAAAKSLQSCLTLYDPIDGSPPGSPIPGELSRKNTGVGCHFLLQCMKVKSESEVAQSRAPPSMGFSRQEYWSGVPLPSP